MANSLIAIMNTPPGAAATLVVSMHRPTDVIQPPTVRQATEMAQIPTANITAPAVDITAMATKVAIMATAAVRLECVTVTACSRTLKSTTGKDHTRSMVITSRTTQSTLA